MVVSSWVRPFATCPYLEVCRHDGSRKCTTALYRPARSSSLRSS